MKSIFCTIICFVAVFSLASCSSTSQTFLNKTWYYLPEASQNSRSVYQDSTINTKPFRGQTSILFLEGGMLIENAANTNDKYEERKGEWTLHKKTLMFTLPSNQQSYTFKIAELKQNEMQLELKPSKGIKNANLSN